MLVKPAFEETCVWLAKPSVQIFTLLDAICIKTVMVCIPRCYVSWPFGPPIAMLVNFWTSKSKTYVKLPYL